VSGEEIELSEIMDGELRWAEFRVFCDFCREMVRNTE
jgi:hypothetical protein